MNTYSSKNKLKHHLNKETTKYCLKIFMWITPVPDLSKLVGTTAQNVNDEKRLIRANTEVHSFLGCSLCCLCKQTGVTTVFATLIHQNSNKLKRRSCLSFLGNLIISTHTTIVIRIFITSNISVLFLQTFQLPGQFLFISVRNHFGLKRKITIWKLFSSKENNLLEMH